MRTLRFLLIARAGRLTRIGGRHVLRLSHNLAAESLYASVTQRLATSVIGRVPVLVEKRNGAFFRLVKCTTNAPPARAATGGTRHGQGYQQAGRSA